jgi:lysozyme family protein
VNWLKTLLGRRGQSAAPAFAATLQKEAGVYVLRISGMIGKETVDRIQAVAARDIESGAKDLKVLILLSDFQGLRRSDNWGNIDFFAQYGKEVAKIAAVGEARWETDILMFLAAGYRKGEVRYFAPEEESKARAWLVS